MKKENFGTAKKTWGDEVTKVIMVGGLVYMSFVTFNLLVQPLLAIAGQYIVLKVLGG